MGERLNLFRIQDQRNQERVRTDHLNLAKALSSSAEFMRSPVRDYHIHDNEGDPQESIRDGVYVYQLDQNFCRTRA